MKHNSKLKIWFIPFNAPLKVISNEEKIFSFGLNTYMKTRFTHSRGYIREVLSRLFLISPLDVPLINSIGKPPLLKESMGYLSLSYSLNNLIICWSLDKVGIDMESRFRNFNAKNLMDRFYLEEEKKIYFFQIIKKLENPFCNIGFSKRHVLNLLEELYLKT